MENTAGTATAVADGPTQALTVPLAGCSPPVPRLRIAAGQGSASGAGIRCPPTEVPGVALANMLMRNSEIETLALHDEVREDFRRVVMAWTADHPEPEHPRAIAG